MHLPIWAVQTAAHLCNYICVHSSLGGPLLHMQWEKSRLSEAVLSVTYYGKLTEKGIFAGTLAGCPRDSRPSKGFLEILCDFFLCAFSAP